MRLPGPWMCWEELFLDGFYLMIKILDWTNKAQRRQGTNEKSMNFAFHTQTPSYVVWKLCYLSAYSVLENIPSALQGKMTERQIHYLVKGANNVRKLVRIKIADDNDLEQAR